MSRTILTIVLCLLTTVSVFGQCRYCKSYKDFLEDKWESLDTVYCKKHSKGHKLMWGGNDYKLTAGDKDIDRILNGAAFAVKQGDEIYVNCRNLRYENMRFGKGYCKAAGINENDLIIVNSLLTRTDMPMVVPVFIPAGPIGSVAAAAAIAGAATGAMAAASGAMTTNKQLKNQVCYVISSAADEQGRYDIKLFDDRMMDKLLLSRELIDLHNAYYEEKDKNKRRLAARVLPILMEAGIIDAEE